METTEIILLNKPLGVTSFEALYPVKKFLNTGKVGHTGTLDKFASGLMLVLSGRALKQQEKLTHLDKCYEGVICFGKETDTLDPEGKIIAEAPPPSLENLNLALEKFRGEITQAPPEYSAIHINGKRASELARAGKKPEMKKRAVTIYELTLVSYTPPNANIFVHCSSGTYLRSLARDIALACDSRGCLVELTRTKIGEYSLADARKFNHETNI
jgi:tRNA pseudouridine55 synthase